MHRPSSITLFWVIASVLAAGVGLFLLLGGGKGSPDDSLPGQVWTCSMHPQVRLPGPGECPICAMPLIVAKSGAGSAEEDADPHAGHAMAESLALSDHARAMAGVETVPAEHRQLTNEIRAVGKVQYNETALAVIVSRVEGYIERLYVDFTGVAVKSGDHLVDIYSPELVVAQQEMLVALSGPANNALTESTALKLRRWGLTEEQVDSLVQNRKISERVTLLSPIEGTVVERLAVKQAMVKAGEVLYRIANLESVWVYLDVYESELAWIQPGREVAILAESYPTESFTGRIWFINPVLSEESRTVKALVNIANTEQKLKPGMFVSAMIQVPILSDGTAAPTGLGGQFTCTMHPQVLQPEAGDCPQCGMALIQIPGDPSKPGEDQLQVLAIPVSAVLDSGVRKLVYVEHRKGEFMPAEVTVGPRAGDYYPVISGLEEGDLVATRGNFLLDSQFQINGLPSLFYKEGDAPAAPHHHEEAAPGSGPEGGAPAAAPQEHEH